MVSRFYFDLKEFLEVCRKPLRVSGTLNINNPYGLIIT